MRNQQLSLIDEQRKRIKKEKGGKRVEVRVKVRGNKSKIKKMKMFRFKNNVLDL